MNYSKNIPAEQYLNELHKQVDQHLQQAISVYQNLSEAELNKPAATGGWSVAQCLEHLNSYGHYYLPQIQERMEKFTGNAADHVKHGWLGNYFIKMMDPDISKAKYKAFKGHIPPVKLEGHVVVTEFIRQQEQLLKLLSAAAAVNLNKIRIPISITRLIRLRLGDTFAFLIAHNERHVRQANASGNIHF